MSDSSIPFDTVLSCFAFRLLIKPSRLDFHRSGHCLITQVPPASLHQAAFANNRRLHIGVWSSPLFVVVGPPPLRRLPSTVYSGLLALPLGRLARVRTALRFGWRQRLLLVLHGSPDEQWFRVSSSGNCGTQSWIDEEWKQSSQ